MSRGRGKKKSQPGFGQSKHRAARIKRFAAKNPKSRKVGKR